jgi:hypothetical protein
LTAMRRPTAPLGCVIGAVLATAAFAQAASYTSVEAIAGKPVQLTYHASAHKNCTPAPAPTVRVTEAPTAGILTVRPAVLTTTKVAGCPRINVPGQVVFYQARQGYAGPDHVRYDVTSANGEVGTFDLTITVKVAPAPKAPGSEQKGTSL